MAQAKKRLKPTRKPASLAAKLKRAPRAHSISSKSVPKLGSVKPRSTVHGRLREHAKHVWHATPKFVHGAVAGAFIGAAIVIQLGWIGSANAISIDTSRDCDDYAIIKCGSLSTAELKQDYNIPGVSTVFNHFGITAADINSIDSTAVMGTIYNDGTIKVDGKTVATDAITASRLSVNGSAKVVENGTTFYVRHLKVSWSHTSAPAYVVMKDGVFQYAILASCGNPVIADAVPAPAPPPPPPATITPEPEPTVPTPEQPIITSPPLTITPVTEPETLPNAGPGALVVVAAASVIGGFLTHHTHRHIKRRRAARAS